MNTSANGTVIIQAGIANGTAQGKDFIQNFIIVFIDGVNPDDGSSPDDGSNPDDGGNPIEEPNPREYSIVLNLFDNESGDTVTASPDKGAAGTVVTLNYTLANMANNNELDFSGVAAHIDPVTSYGAGTRTYTINSSDASDGVITITAIFTHTDLIIDHIAFNDTSGHITKTYGDLPFTNAITGAHNGTGTIRYHSDNPDVATVNSSGQVTILKHGSAVISAEKEADSIYAHSTAAYTLTVNRKPVTITGLSAEDKTYDGTTTATVTGTAVINGRVGSDDVTAVPGTASFADAAVGNNKTVTFSGWTLGGAAADNYTLSAQPASVTANIFSIEMVPLSAGTFTMGSPSTESTNTDERPQHQVTLNGFYIGKYEVMQEQYYAVMGNNPSSFTTAVDGENGTPGKLPVENVSWYAALVFCNKLSMIDGLSPAYRINGSTDPSAWGNIPTANNTTWNAVSIVAGSTGYRLPTEAQWEYACRAGTTTAYNTGSNTISDDTGWYEANSGSKTHQVGLKPPNAWGLYDMHGNVSEWCWDRYSDAYYTSNPMTEPMGPSSGDRRIRRGGGGTNTPTILRSAYRSVGDPHTANSNNYYYGFRVVRPLSAAASNGSADNPFLVTNKTELRKVGTGTYGWTVSAHYRQTADITLSSENFTRIGTNTSGGRFTETYDGGNYTITNLSMTATGDFLGIFTYIDASGTVKNMNVTGTITQNGNQTTGGIAALNYGTIDNCSFSGTVNSGTTCDYVGGIAGLNNGTVKNSRSGATVSGKNYVGGIVGWNEGKLENSYNTGAVSGDQRVGGIVGYNNESASTLQNCVSLGAKIITSTNSVYTGRVFGVNSSATNGNSARADMVMGRSGQEAEATSGIGAGAQNGASVSLNTALSTVFGSVWDTSTSWNTISGNLTVGGDLPTFQTNTQSPKPTLPLPVLGTAGNPFLVTNQTELRNVGSGTGGWTLSAHYKQTAAISLSGTFTRIGDSTNRFTGSYDGGGYAITGLSMSVTSAAGNNCQGLFGYIGAAGTVKNVNVSGGTISVSNGVSVSNVGGIAGQNDGVIINCRFTGSNGATGRNQVGGIAGTNEGGAAGVTNGGKIDNCYNTAPVVGNNQVGGIVGTNAGSQASIKNSYNTGSITGGVTTSANIGGIVGYQNSLMAEYCYNTGTVYGSTAVGGIAGNVPNGCTVQYCVSLGAKVTGGSTNTGRVVGAANGNLNNNSARLNMVIGASGSEVTATGTATSANGADVSLSTAQTSVFSSWDTAIWNIGAGNLTTSPLPTLRDNTQSPGPTLP